MSQMSGKMDIVTVLEFLRAGDELVVHRLDRLGGSTRDVLNFVHELDAIEASLRILEPEVTTAGDMGGVGITVLGIVADMELTFIRDRRSLGYRSSQSQRCLQGAAENGKRCGSSRPAANGVAKAQIARNLGVSRMTVYRALESRGT